MLLAHCNYTVNFKIQMSSYIACMQGGFCMLATGVKNTSE